MTKTIEKKKEKQELADYTKIFGDRGEDYQKLVQEFETRSKTAYENIKKLNELGKEIMEIRDEMYTRLLKDGTMTEELRNAIRHKNVSRATKLAQLIPVIKNWIKVSPPEISEILEDRIKQLSDQEIKFRKILDDAKTERDGLYRVVDALNELRKQKIEERDSVSEEIKEGNLELAKMEQEYEKMDPNTKEAVDYKMRMREFERKLEGKQANLENINMAIGLAKHLTDVYEKTEEAIRVSIQEAEKVYNRFKLAVDIQKEGIKPQLVAQKIVDTMGKTTIMWQNAKEDLNKSLDLLGKSLDVITEIVPEIINEKIYDEEVLERLVQHVENIKRRQKASRIKAHLDAEKNK
jgi:chromosome segregation ATPase